MDELTVGVNWLAVIISFVLSFMLGWLWFSPKLFGKKWADGVPGVSMEDDCGGKPPALAMITQALGVFGFAWLVGVTASYNALVTLMLIVITIILLIISNGKFANKSNTAVIIEAAYILDMVIIMAICQALL